MSLFDEKYVVRWRNSEGVVDGPADSAEELSHLRLDTGMEMVKMSSLEFYLRCRGTFLEGSSLHVPYSQIFAHRLECITRDNLIQKLPEGRISFRIQKYEFNDDWVLEVYRIFTLTDEEYDYASKFLQRKTKEQKLELIANNEELIKELQEEIDKLRVELAQ